MARLTSFLSQLGHYRIVEKLGGGGMGDVYLAEDTQLHCLVALKIPRFEVTDVKLVERFYREARLAQSIPHPLICPVYDFGEVDGVHYLTMPYIEGTPLDQLVGSDRPWPERRAAELVRRLALAVQALHQRQVIHRDLKPHNIILRANDEPVLVDFGLARALGEAQHLTSKGNTLGTPAYMAPEQIDSKLGQPGPAADVYSLGVILYELLTGCRPFEADNLMSLFFQVLNEPPPVLSSRCPGLDSRLEALCQKALAKKPGDRYASMAELATALGELHASALNLSPPPVFRKHPDRVPVPETIPDLAAAVRETASRLQSAKRLPGEITNSLGMAFVLVRRGTFLMGSPPDERGRFADESQHPVTLTRDFYLASCPVTQALWREVTGESRSRFRGDNRPVERVSWEDCQEFCRQLARLDDRPYRLPTEAEWEYACRAGTSTAYFFGASLSSLRANCDHRDPTGQGTTRGAPTPAGTFPANAWGLYDMHGNVSEWCADWYGPYPAEALEDYVGPEYGDFRVLRGGSWSSPRTSCRSACRFQFAPGDRHSDFGCRVCFSV